MKGIDKNMRLVINEKVFDSKEFKGTEAELLEQLVYEFLNINSVVMMERLAVVYEMLIGYIKDVLEKFKRIHLLILMILRVIGRS